MSEQILEGDDYFIEGTVMKKKLVERSRTLYFLFIINLLITFFGFSQDIGGKCVPPSGKTLLIVGQDLASLADYVNSGHFPVPGGTTGYFGGYDNAALENDRDWGAGPLNAQKNLDRYPQSTLALGMSIVEKYFPNGLTKILDGDYDGSFKDLANFIKDAERPVYLRIGYEFDGNWNKYDPEKYKKAFEYIVKIIRPIAGKNFVSVWQACTSPIDDVIEGYHEDIADWYPGDEWVDWCGASWFLIHKDQYDLTDEMLTFAREHKKPVMVAESSPQGYDLLELNKKNTNKFWDGAAGTGEVAKSADEIWDEWFKPFFEYVHTNSDVIRSVAYINADWDSQSNWGPPYRNGYWGDSRFEVNDALKSKWITEITGDSWVHGSDSLFEVLFENSIDIKSTYNNSTFQNRCLLRANAETVHFTLNKAAQVDLTIRNCAGALIDRIKTSGYKGRNIVRWDLHGKIANGFYFVQLRVDGKALETESFVRVR